MRNLGVTVAGILLVLSLALIVLYLDRPNPKMRPVAVARQVAGVTRTVITSVSQASEAVTTQPGTAEHRPAFAVPSRRPGSIQAIGTHGLVAWASQHRCQLGGLSAVGDSTAIGWASPCGTSPQRVRYGLVRQHDLGPLPPVTMAAVNERIRGASAWDGDIQ